MCVAAEHAARQTNHYTSSLIFWAWRGTAARAGKAPVLCQGKEKEMRRSTAKAFRDLFSSAAQVSDWYKKSISYKKGHKRVKMRGFVRKRLGYKALQHPSSSPSSHHSPPLLIRLHTDPWSDARKIPNSISASTHSHPVFTANWIFYHRLGDEL